MLFADMSHQIDNMGAHCASRSVRAVVVTLVSHDNFSVLQRTLLLQFTLAGE